MTEPTETTGWIPSRRVLLVLLAIVAAGAIANGILVSGLGGAPLADYDNSVLDVDAYDELANRGVHPCPAVGDPLLPDDLADRLDLTCVPYDAGAGFGVALFGLGVLGSAIVMTSGNRFGLYMLMVAVVMVNGSGAGEAYAVRAILLRPGSLPFGQLASLLALASWVVVGVVLVPRMILVFPTGTLPSHRWRWVTRATYVPATALIISGWLAPFGIQDVRSTLPYQWSNDVALDVFELGLFGWIALVMVSFAGLLWRFVTARGEERQQMKWVAYAVALALVVNLAASLFSEAATGTVQQIANFVILPAAALISIFKFRLYDIDRIINRTVVYSIVSVLSAGLFAAVIVIPQSFLFVWGQDFDNRLVLIVAPATLVVAAAFNPLRRRVQRAVDRRFDRTRYDAQQVVDEFHSRLQDPKRLDALVDDVADVVNAALAPERVGVWTPGSGT